jgi:cell division protein FtsI/penicillin-binding protein 2
VIEIKKGRILKEIVKFVTNRQLISFIVVSLCFYLLLARLFNLQIVNGHTYATSEVSVDKQTMPIPTTRGNIYDHLGRPLAINTSSFAIQMDPAVAEMNAQVFYDLLVMLERNGETVIDNFPISETEPYSFEVDRAGTTEERWKKDMAFVKDPVFSTEKNPITGPSLTAEECFIELRERFKVPEELSNSEARKVLNICSMLYMQRFNTLVPVIIAYNAKPSTIANLTEENVKYKGITAVESHLRQYPEGKYFSSIVGYLALQTQAEYEVNKGKGYSIDDAVGRSGIELSYESVLRGKAGSVEVELDSSNKIVKYLDEVPPEPGKDVFLTLDRDLQAASYDILEQALVNALVAELKGEGGIKNQITLPQLFASISRNSVYTVSQIMAQPEGAETAGAAVKAAVLAAMPEADASTSEGVAAIREVIALAVEDGTLSPLTMLKLMMEQSIISGSVESLPSKVNVLSEVVARIESGEITPQMAALDPSTGSIVVVDTKNGEVLAAVGYPSFDANRFVNSMDSAYYSKLRSDTTSPLLNRPFVDARAPGSTLKMVTAIAALESEAITPDSTIYDHTTFTAAGGKAVSCWSAVSHGAITVSQALEVSCNYFFCEAVYRLGNTKSGTKLDAISTMNKYMRYFGLGSKTGVEIREGDPSIASPKYKLDLFDLYNPNAPEYDREWHDGDTLQVAIGQGYNNITPASMAKYITTIANKGTRYSLHLVDSVMNASRTEIDNTRPTIEDRGLDVKDSTWDVIYEGMLLVTQGSKGTGRAVFSDFPITVAGKTGTADEQTGRNAHSSFGGFAPFEDPEIAVYVSVPFGDTKASPSIAAQIAKRVMAEYFALGLQPQNAQAENVLVK